MSTNNDNEDMAQILNALGGTPAPSVHQPPIKTRAKKPTGKETKVRFLDAPDTSGEEMNEVAQQVVPPANRLTKTSITVPSDEEDNEDDVPIRGGKGVQKMTDATPSYVVMSPPCHECQLAHEECRTTQ